MYPGGQLAMRRAAPTRTHVEPGSRETRELPLQIPPNGQSWHETASRGSSTAHPHRHATTSQTHWLKLVTRTRQAHARPLPAHAFCCSIHANISHNDSFDFWSVGTIQRDSSLSVGYECTVLRWKAGHACPRIDIIAPSDWT